MCGRYVFLKGEHFYQQFEIDFVDFDPPDQFNVAPTQMVPTIVMHDGKRAMVQMRWGLIPFWAKDPSIGSRMINARSETIHEKPAFRTAFRKRRCLIPARGFYEWQKLPGGRKQPLYIYLKSGAPFVFAGLWEEWAPKDRPDQMLQSCTIITTTPNEMMASFHHRMPVILPPHLHTQWLDPDFEDLDALKAMLTSYPADDMTYHPVSMLVNSPVNNLEACIAPLDRTE